MTIIQKGGKKMRLIDADALAELLKREAEHHEADGLLERSYGVLDAYMDVLQAPTVHPEQPKMGKWIVRDNPGTGWYRITCSECGEDVTSVVPTIGFMPNVHVLWNFCPECGAKMEESNGATD